MIEKWNKIVEDYCLNHDIQALSVCIHQSNQTIFEKSWGKTSLKGRRVKKDTLFTIGSVSKIFTTTALLMLIEQGKCTLDQPVYTLLEDFTMKDERYKEITVRMILSHCAGFYGNTPIGKYTLSANRDYLEQVLSFMSESELKDEPGKFSVYCNDGFAIAEALIEQLSQMSYAEFIEEAILTPCNMKHTEFPDHEIREGRIVYAKTDYNTDYPQEYVNGIGSGGIYSTAEDLCLFMEALESDVLLSVASKAEMNVLQNPLKMEIEKFSGDHYGLGWDSVDLNTAAQFNLKAMAKSGSTYGFGSYIIHCPEAHIHASIVMSMVEGSPSTLLKTLFTEVLMELGYQKQELMLPKLESIKDNLIEGVYGNCERTIKVKLDNDKLLLEEYGNQKQWIFEKNEHTWRSKEAFLSKKDPDLYFVEVENKIYMIVEYRILDYRQRTLLMEKLEDCPTEIKCSCDNQVYLLDNEYPTQRCLGHLPMILKPIQLDGYLLTPYPLKLQSDTQAKSFIELPGNYSREMVPFNLNEDGSFTLGMAHYIPIQQVKSLTSTEFIIQNQKTMWFVGNNTLDNIKMDGLGRCIMVNQAGIPVFDSELSWSMPEDLNHLYIGFMGRNQTKITIECSEN